MPQTGSCLREIMPLSRYIQTFVPRNFFHQQRTLEDFSPVLLWQKKSYLMQFTLVKQKVSELTLHSVIWGGVSVKKNTLHKKFLIMVIGHPEPAKNVTAPAFMNIM